MESPEVVPSSRPPQLPEPPVLDLGPGVSTETARRPPARRNVSNLFLFRDDSESGADEGNGNLRPNDVEKPADVESESDGEDSTMFFRSAVTFNKSLNAKLTAPVSYDRLFSKEQDALPGLL